MKRGNLTKIFWTCFPSIPVILILFFFLPYLVYKQHKLLLSTYEFIIVAKSSRVAVFAVFNAIVITIFLGHSKPSLADSDGVFLSSPSVYEAYTVKEKEHDEDYDSCEERNEHHGDDDGYDEDNDDDLDTEDVDSEDESVIDLERRIESFIAQVYKKWREESLAETILCLEPPS